ncbi:helix-turn-helix transcriptional regulator [Paenibacillus sp. IB182496]|uniref:Helix-turn-helix transcriptional regulator n=1 Tax=Paenibacillus sabuli TaxID=2772509 RepID=A0A927GT18_9BACL|nr:AraC family transcriptional regulator [Paenibacillus sabuli]MBD2846871.1 helix-turn-helix transcriptional regulator [Paenibacillus sabuli]
MTNPNQLKQQVPHPEPGYPFDIFHIAQSVPAGNPILHLHWHDDWEIIRFLRGRAVFHIGSETIRPEPGDLLFVNQGRIHTGFAEDDEPVAYDALVFHSSLVGSSLADAYHTEITAPYMSGRSLFPSRLTPRDEGYARIVSHVDRLVEEYAAVCKGFQLAIRTILQLLLVDLTRHNDRAGLRAHDDSFAAELTARFKALISHVERHYAEKITVQQAAAIVNLSDYHFCRTFKKMTGKTFIDYVNLHRVNAAEQLLIETEEPVTEIAFRVGFGSVNYFSQLFRHYKRVSPSQCRKAKRLGQASAAGQVSFREI